MTIIAKNNSFFSNRATPAPAYYPLHVTDFGIHRPFSHRYSVFVQFRYCAAMQE